MVGLLPIFLSKDRTLEKLYFEPLRARIKQNGGWVYTPGVTFWLWVEIKSEPKPPYQRLRQVLKEYQDIFTRLEDGGVRTNAVTVVLTVRRPVELICAEASRLAALDCRITE